MTMNGLPPSLEAWSGWLAWFAPELRSMLGPFLQRLAPMLGPLNRADHEGQDDVDGLGDLRRRGAYQRLLSSEWLLAMDLPDEFLRRAVNNEHLFLAPRRRAPRNDRMFVALFDAGPLQLGAPRVVHVAMWILLARRAAEAGGWLRWGVLQVPGQWHDAAVPADLKQLLSARSFEHAQPRHLQSWQDSLRALEATPQEIWRIGGLNGPGASPWTVASHHAGVSRGLDTRWLDMEIRQGGLRRQVQLELPEASQAISLLKGQFLAPAQPAVRQQMNFQIALRQPVLSTTGARVALHLLDGDGLLIVQIPPTASAKVAKGKRAEWAQGASPLAVSFNGKRVSAMLGVNGGLHVWNGHGFPWGERPPADAFQAPPGAASQLPAAYLQHGKLRQYLVVDRAGRLLCWQPDEIAAGTGRPALRMTRLDEQVLGLWQPDNTLVFYAALYAGWLWVRKRHLSQGDGQGMPVCAATGDKVLFGGGPAWRRDVGACALRLDKTPIERWRLNVPLGTPGSRARQEGPLGPSSMAFRHVDIALPAGWRGLGVIPVGADARAYAMLAMDQARTGLHTHDGERGKQVYTAPSRLHSVTVCPQTGMVAMLTEDRQFIAFSMSDRSLRTITQFSAS